mmetsp:Transcript_43612/g.120676  ORF Transcript_43612/g.120676 Transcript_43612/m.120676 type:complete len:216 (-) Transcript_43612:1129-1776(-)
MRRSRAPPFRHPRPLEVRVVRDRPIRLRKLSAEDLSPWQSAKYTDVILGRWVFRELKHLLHRTQLRNAAVGQKPQTVSDDPQLVQLASDEEYRRARFLQLLEHRKHAWLFPSVKTSQELVAHEYVRAPCKTSQDVYQVLLPARQHVVPEAVPYVVFRCPGRLASGLIVHLEPGSPKHRDNARSALGGRLVPVHDLPNEGFNRLALGHGLLVHHLA